MAGKEKPYSLRKQPNSPITHSLSWPKKNINNKFIYKHTPNHILSLVVSNKKTVYIPEKQTNGTQKLLVWVDVSPFLRGIFRFNMVVFQQTSIFQRVPSLKPNIDTPNSHI